MINVLDISITTYRLIFALTAMSIATGSLFSGLLNRYGVMPAKLLGFGLISAATSALALLDLDLGENL